MPRLEQWKMGEQPGQEFVAPELRKKFLQGNVYGHPRFADGFPVNTSSLVSFDSKSRIAQTKNTTYELGEMDPDYKEWCINNGLIESEVDNGK